MKPKDPQLVSSSASTKLKGLHTKNLIGHWHKLLHVRVKVQNILDIVNVLPVGHLEAIEAPELKEHAARVLADTRSLASDFATRVLDLPAAEAASAATLDVRLEERQRSLLSWHEPVLADWHERASLGGGLNKLAQHPVQRLQALLADRDRLLSRCRLNRSRLRPLRLPADDGDAPEAATATDAQDSEPPESDPNLYDDSDLYKLVLLDFVHSRTAGIADPLELGREFARLQQLRRRLRKRAVDTRASKARRLRYLEMAKLVNFAAATEPPGQLADGQRRELYASLFGRLAGASAGQLHQQQQDAAQFAV